MLKRQKINIVRENKYSMNFAAKKQIMQTEFCIFVSGITLIHK